MSDFGETLIQEVRKIAAENHSHVYGPTNCSYMLDGEPSCIMGKALYNLGYLPAPALEAKGIAIEGKSIRGLVSDLGFQIDSSEGLWLDCVQAAQDGRVYGPEFSQQGGGRASWGEAVEYADNWAAA